MQDKFGYELVFYNKREKFVQLFKKKLLGKILMIFPLFTYVQCTYVSNIESCIKRKNYKKGHGKAVLWFRIRIRIRKDLKLFGGSGSGYGSVT
jgi:hypothetical protein